MKKPFIAASIALTVLGAQAQIYGELGTMSVTAKDDVPPGEVKASPLSVRAILGYELTPNLAVEGMLAAGVKKAAMEVNGQKYASLPSKLDNAMGFYLKPKNA